MIIDKDRTKKFGQEKYMWRTTEHKTPTGLTGNCCEEKVQIQMGERSFVDAIFGDKRELEKKTENLMTDMRLWSQRFDANCEEIG
jgi:hypothetical protein